MNYWRLTLVPRSPLSTPLQSDTLYGHLCWAVRYAWGEAALREFIEQSGTQVLALSDAFPAGFLPKPLCTPISRDRQKRWVSRHFARDEMQGYQRLKLVRKTRLIPEEIFAALRNGLSEEALCDGLLARSMEQPQIHAFRQAHNRIDRLTGRTPEKGGLYFTEAEAYAPDFRFTVYLATDFLEQTKVKDLFSMVGESGYGKDSTIGRGRFDISEMTDASTLFLGDGNRRMSLSRGVLTDEMKNSLYRLFTKYGRLGGGHVNDASGPFKYPIVLTEPGATFVSEDPFPGGLIRNVHPHLEDVVHMGRHLTVPFTEVSS